ncbi:MAG: PDZ domain-containing protein [Pseudomonadota bacterium]
MPYRILVSLALLGVTLSTFANASGDTRLLRFPDIHRDQVVFVYAGDVYLASTSGGVARRLTSHSGLELFPKFSPDGSRIAFSAEYNGTRQVYVMPAAGGTPTQLTWYNDVGPMPPRGGFDYRVLDWTPDGKHILVRANRLPWGVRMGRYYLIPADGGDEQPLAVPEGGGGMFSPDGKQLVYTPVDREFRTWKRYRGGRAQEVWTYDLENDTAAQLTDNRATDHQPLWVGNDIFFVSDRDYTLNLYRHVQDANPERLTSHEDFDVLWPSAGPEAIVYENGGWLYRYNPASNTSNRLNIEIAGDLPERMPRIVEAGSFIQSADLSPDGQRVVYSARGEVFTVPAEQGPVRALTRTPAVREIDATWSPDGRQVAYLSDESGEYEIWVRPQDGSGSARQVTEGGDTWRFAPVWSPDGDKLLFGDKRQRLNIVEVDSGRVSVVDTSRNNDIEDYAWSPDSRFVVYTKDNSAGFGSLWIYAAADGSTRQVTSDMSNDFNGVFDPQGRYLYFLSSRDQDLEFSSVEFNYMVTNSIRVYAAQLNADQPALFLPKSDEVSLDDADADNGGEDRDDDNGAEDAVRLRIDYDGLAARVVALQDAGGEYSRLSATASGPLYLSGEGEDAKLHLFDVESEEQATVLEGIDDYTLSANGEKLLFASGDKWGIAKVEPEQDADKGHVNLDNLELRIEPQVEWRQMYTDGWRILRDWFYDPNMHGQDWQAIHDRYLPLVEHVAHRADLDYILGEIAGEMNAGHIYVQSGDQPATERRNGGLLGAEFEAADGYYRISKLFAGEAWHAAFYSPLAAPGVDVNVGDYVLAVNGVSTQGVDNFYSLLENTGGDVVSLRINGAARERGARDVLVRTISSETQLRYLDWVEERARRVEQLSGGRIGYVHLPNTATAGNRELFKRFLPQVRKEALIIDARYNGGGFIPDRMIEIVARTPLNYWKRRGLDPQATPVISHTGPKATLINGYSSSGGDAFPYYFRKLGLGPLIGTRTWGGLIGISGNPMLADGGGILASTFRFIDTDGNWAVENEGVAPDIEVLDRPELVASGQDPTLERAVRHLLDELGPTAAKPIEAPPAPTDF